MKKLNSQRVIAGKAKRSKLFTSYVFLQVEKYTHDCKSLSSDEFRVKEKTKEKRSIDRISGSVKKSIFADHVTFRRDENPIVKCLLHVIIRNLTKYGK